MKEGDLGSPNQNLERTGIPAAQINVLLQKMMNQRKLSDILIEIAMQGLSSPGHGHSVVMHPLMWLAHVAWNREVRDPNYMLKETPSMLSKFYIPSDTLQSHLISVDWSVVVERMREYKRERFPDDTRFITVCAYTPRGTLRVEFE